MRIWKNRLYNILDAFLHIKQRDLIKYHLHLLESSSRLMASPDSDVIINHSHRSGALKNSGFVSVGYPSVALKRSQVVLIRNSKQGDCCPRSLVGMISKKSFSSNSRLFSSYMMEHVAAKQSYITALVKPPARKAAPGRSTPRKRRKRLLTIDYWPFKDMAKT